MQGLYTVEKKLILWGINRKDINWIIY